MTGPPYPPNPVVNSNAIGTFEIAVSPVGTITAFDPWVAIISQYANSPILTGIITSFNAAVDETENIDNFYDLVWNIATAQGDGLDVWGRIVGVTRALQISGSLTYLGFDEAGSWTGFGQGGFYTGAGTTNSFLLADADFRNLILAKAAGNISSGSITAINEILLTLFPNRGACWVGDGLNMTMTYNFAFNLTAVEAAIVAQENVLPNPCGVAITIVQGAIVP